MDPFLQPGDRRQLEKQAQQEGRLPPGQSLTLKWPVLHYGSVPHFDESKWDFKISGELAAPLKLSWKEFRALRQTEVTSDFHCVTRWSRLDNTWNGVLFTEVLKLVQPTPPNTAARSGSLFRISTHGKA
jgi:DMSO/TMAO reductase YedYZ molybdopterin-dependent catalytic subunit